MAVAFRSASGIVFTTQTNTTLTAPAGIQNGDILVISFIIYNPSGTPATPTPPAGFSVLPGPTYPIDIVSGGSHIHVRQWYKVASSESGNYTITHTNAGVEGWIGAYSGADTTTPFSPNATSATGTGTTSTATGLTTPRNSSAVLYMCADWQSGGSNLAAPTGTTPTFTKRFGMTGNNPSNIFIADGILATAGATGNKSNGNNNNAGEGWSAVLACIQAIGSGSQTLTAPLYSDAESFFAATFAAGAVNLAPPLYSDTETFFSATFTKGAVNLAPPLFSDTDSFFNATVLSTKALTAPLYADAETFFAATFVPGAVNLTAPLFSDAEAFFSATLESSGVSTFDPARHDLHVVLSGGDLVGTASSGTLFVNLFGTTSHSSGKWIYRATINNFNPGGDGIGIGLGNSSALSINGGADYLSVNANGYELFEEGSFCHNNSCGSLGTSFGTGDTVDVAFDADNLTVQYSINGGTWTATQSVADFAGQEVFPGVDFGFQGHIVTFSGSTVGALSGFLPWDTVVAANLTPPLFSDTESFFAATFAPGAVNLTAPLFSDADVFFNAAVTSSASLAPPLYADAETFFSATFTRGAVNLAPPLYADTETFFSATVASGAVNLAPALFADTETFFSATLGRGAVNLAPALFSDAETFFSASVTSAANLTPPLFADAEAFFNATVAAGAVNLAPPLFADTDTFFSATLAPGAVNLAPALFTDAELILRGNAGAGDRQPRASAVYRRRRLLFGNADLWAHAAAGAVRRYGNVLLGDSHAGGRNPSAAALYGCRGVLWCDGNGGDGQSCAAALYRYGRILLGNDCGWRGRVGCSALYGC